MTQFSIMTRLGICAVRNTQLYTIAGELAKARLPTCGPLGYSNPPKRGITAAAARGSLTPNCTRTFDRCFHTSQPRSIHPILLVVLRPLTKFAGVLVGRHFRKWWQSLPAERRLYFFGKIKEMRFRLLASGGVACMSGGVYYGYHIEEAPITKRRRFILFSVQQLESISNDMFKTHVEEHEKKIVPTNHPVYEQVARVTNRLLQANSDLPQLYDKKWTVTIIDDPSQQNAFTLPNGQIFVFTGMLELCSNDDQLGTIISHEMAHAILQHVGEKLSQTQIITFAMMIILAAVWAIMPTDITAALGHFVSHWASNLVLELPYSRKLETEADIVGLELSAKACFDVRESSVFWAKMDALQKFVSSDTSIEWLSTHPSHETRASSIEEFVPEAIERRQKCKCPVLPALDPRNQVQNFKKMLDELRQDELAKVAVVLPLPQPKHGS